MENHAQPSAVASAQPRTYRVVRAVLVGGMFSLAGYGLASYGALPTLWKFYETRHPVLALAAPRAFTAQAIPGDPINLAFIGTQAELMDAAKADLQQTRTQKSDLNWLNRETNSWQKKHARHGRLRRPGRGRQ